MKTLLAGAFALGFATISHAQMVTAADAQGVADALVSMGLEARLETMPNGNPHLRSSAGGVNFSVWFYGCSDGLNCNGLGLASGFRYEDPQGARLVNDWNGAAPFGRAYLDNGAVYLDQFIPASVPGIPLEVFTDAISRWIIALDAFADHMGA